ncbi:MAG: DUF4834 family protein [Tannerella sp.]|jgi:hypothetical protein|nr:DUF4834 family protein [Tannerella sp.]
MTRFIIIILLIVFVIPYLIGVIGKFLLGNRYRQNASSHRNGNSSSSFNAQKNTKKKKKVFGKDEGEYVDYVEIKEK